MMKNLMKIMNKKKIKKKIIIILAKKNKNKIRNKIKV